MPGYRSKYGAAGDVTAAQKAAEEVCERAAAHAGTPLVQKFWSEPAWRATYASQVRAAHRLLKLYSEEALFGALRANPRFRSLGPAFVSDAVRAEQDRVDRLTQRAEESAPVTPTNAEQAPRQGVRRAGSKLQGL